MHKRWVTVIAIIGGWMAAQGSARGQSRPEDGPGAAWPVGEMRAMLKFPEVTAEGRAATARLVGALTSADFAVREGALTELKARGVGAYPGLREAVAASKDAELQAVTAGLVGAGKFDVPPGVPALVKTWVARYEAGRPEYLKSVDPMGDSSDRLLVDFHDFGVPSQLFLEIMLAQESDVRARATLERALVARARGRARLAIAEGKLDEAERLLLGSDLNMAREDYVALRALRMGSSFDPGKELAPEKGLAKLRTLDTSTAQASALVYQAKGDFSRAADFAAGSFDTTGRRMLIEAGRFRELAGYLESHKHPEYDVDGLIAYMATGDERKCHDGLDDLIKAHGELALKGFVPLLLVRCDRAEEGIALSQRVDDRFDSAFHLLCAQLRIREALAAIKDRKNATLDIPRQLVEQGLNSAARNLLKDMRPTEPRMGRSWQETYFQYAEQWALAGQLEEAVKWRERGFALIQPLVLTKIQLDGQISALRKVKEDAMKADPTGTLAMRLNAANLDSLAAESSWCEDLADTASFFGEALSDREKKEAWVWFHDVLKRSTPLPRERYELALRIVQGKVSGAELSKCIGEAVQASGPTAAYGGIGSFQEVVESLHQIHRDDMALEAVRRFEAVSTPIAWAMMGDIALANETPVLAAEYYRRAAVVDPTDATLMYRLGWALSRQADTKAAGERLMAYAPMLVLADYEGARQLAETTRHLQGEAIGDAWFEAFTRRYSFMSESVMGNNWVIARDAAEARGDFSGALELQKKMLFSNAYLRDEYYNVPVAMMTNVAAWHRLRALDGWVRKDFVTVADALWREMDNGPPDVALLEKVVPALKAVDEAGAEKVLARAVGRLAPVVEDYPEAARYGGELRRVEALRK